jgi:hypothetical protein
MSDRSLFADNDKTLFPRHLIEKAINYNLRPLFETGQRPKESGPRKITGSTIFHLNLPRFQSLPK